jgi:hypothetical protein
MAPARERASPSGWYPFARSLMSVNDALADLV